MMIRRSRRPRLLAAIVLLLLAAAALRLADLPGVPPGMTHDEADHGLTAWGILSGAHGLYFPIGYGREPLYDYATAIVMAGSGPTLLAARLTSVYLSLLLMAAVYAWARRAFGAPVALLTAAGLAVGFWPLMAARQALRSIALPALFSLAVLAYWEALAAAGRPPPAAHRRRPAVLFALAGLFLGLTFYTYIPARALWLAFPALALYLRLSGRFAARAAWGMALTLAVAAAIAAPLFVYLAANPGLEARVSELSSPLAAAAAGDFGPLAANAAASLRLFTLEGDQTWRYNIPGLPFLPFPVSWLFYAGLLVAVWLAARGLKRRQAGGETGFTGSETAKSAESLVSLSPRAAGPGAFLALVWLALGFAPVAVTGPGLATTQAIGVLPVLYLFPALALVMGYEAVMRLWDDRRRTTDDSQREQILAVVRGLSSAAAIILFAALGIATARDYFGRWASSPEVRVQYETAMVTALRYLDEQGRGAAVVSTITPGQYHTPAVALLTLHNPAVRPRWFDGRQSLLLPAEPGSTLILPGFTPLPAALQPYLAQAALVEELPMRPDDLDRPLRVYSVNGPAAIEASLARVRTPDPGPWTPVAFGDYLEFLGYELSAIEARPGETVSLVTAWRLRRPLPGAALFAHVVGPDGAPVTQADALGAPGESWVAGDVLMQLHELAIPPGAAPGDYPLVVGAYVAPDGPRLPVAGTEKDQLELTRLRIR